MPSGCLFIAIMPVWWAIYVGRSVRRPPPRSWRWKSSSACIARLPASHEAGYRWRAHENLWRSLRELRSLPGEGGDPALRPEDMLHCRADKIDLRGGVVRTNREAEDFVGEPFGEWKIAALPAGVAVGV